MQISFFKYQGTGNDFIIVDNRMANFPKNKDFIIHLCDRKFGIGSDGLILIEEDESSDFYMDFYNPDASQSFCGNGSRCAVAFAKRIGIINNECSFKAIDGPHSATISEGIVEVSMKDVADFKELDDAIVMDTGSPHYVTFVDDLDKIDILEEGRKVRYSDAFRSEGINVNFVEKGSEMMIGATYERGVENETLSCGTGVTAMALATGIKLGSASPIRLKTKGGSLEVHFEKEDGIFRNIRLKAAATFVFKGEIQVNEDIR